MNWKFWKKKEAPKAPITEAATAVAEAVAVSAPATVEVAVTAPPNVTVTVEKPVVVSGESEFPEVLKEARRHPLIEAPSEIPFDTSSGDIVLKDANKGTSIGEVYQVRSSPTDYDKMKIAKPKTKKKGNHAVIMVKAEPVPETVEAKIERMNQQAEKLRLERKAKKNLAKKKKEA